jgi:predicted transport protein
VYRVFDFFVEVIPRKQRLDLLLNLELGECDDPTGGAMDSAEYSFIINASQSGGVLFSLKKQENIPGAVHLIRQAYQGVSE